MHRHGDTTPAVVLDHVGKRYEALRHRPVEHFFARFGGIVPGGVIDDEDEDEDVLFDEDAAQPDDEQLERAQSAQIALDDVSLTLTGGSCVAVTGPRKSGKSSLLNVIAGIVPPTSGRILVRGVVAPAVASAPRTMMATFRLQRSLTVLAAQLGIPPEQMRSHLEQIIAFAEAEDVRRVHVANIPSRRRREIITMAMLSLDADIVLIDGALPRKELRTKCVERIAESKAAGALVVLTLQEGEQKVPPAVDRMIVLRNGRVVEDSPYTLPAPEPLGEVETTDVASG